MSKLGVMKYLVVYLGILAMGILIGMTFQQAITQSTLMKVAGSLDGVQIDIDLNETQIIKGITDFYKPYFEEMINKSEDTVIFNATVDELGGAKLMGLSCYRECMHVSCTDQSEVIDVRGCMQGDLSYFDKDYGKWYRTVNKTTYKLDIEENIWYINDVLGRKHDE